MEPCAQAYEALAAKHSANAVVMMDPNVRPSFIADADMFRARMTRLFALCDIVKLSDEDLAWLIPGATLEEAARQLVAGGVKLLCITQGSEGVTGYTPGGEVFVPANKATVVDTVGAGDTFNAGLLASLHQAGVLTKSTIGTMSDDVIRAALAMGAKTAAITVSRAGANPPWAHEL